jgi:hypothetical protein
MWNKNQTRNYFKDERIKRKREIYGREPTAWVCRWCQLKTILKGIYHWESECTKNNDRKLWIINEPK